MTRLPLNSRILEYKITGNLGAGGFAHTYLALDTNLDKTVAIKEFFPARLCARGEAYRVSPLAGSEERFEKYLSSFIEEARILAKFDQPNIVKVLRYFEALGTAYIIMEYVDGRPVDDYFAFDNVLGEARVAKWMSGLLKGLAAIHEAGIIHGDIKPRNILITDGDEAVLIDFGASVIYKAAQESAEPIEEMHLSSSYAAPEQLTPGAALDHRLDLYALGAVFYQAITGEKLKEAQEAGTSGEEEILRYRRFYHRKLLASIARAIEREPEARFSDAGQWLDFISLTPGERFARGLKRHRKAVAAAALLVALLGYGTYYITANQIDTRNVYYKVFAGQAEVLEKLRSADAAIVKLQQARDFLNDYGYEFAVQLGKIADDALVTGRNNKASLGGYEAAVTETRGAIEAAIEQLQFLRDRYYFDDLTAPLSAVNGKIKAFGARQLELNTLLLAAYVEAQVVERAAALSIDINQAALAELITSVQSGEDLEDLRGLVPRGDSLVTTFLRQQQDANARIAFEARRKEVIEEIRDIAEPLRNNPRFGEFAAPEQMAEQAKRPAQLDLALEAAQGLAGQIRNEQRQAAAHRAKQKRDSERRVIINAIDASMLEVPADKFTMGSNRHGYARPPRTVQVHGFFIQRHEVTVQQWSECVRDGACQPTSGSGGPGFPVTGVTWDATQTFIQWINDHSSRFRYRLLSEAEWEFVIKKYGYVLKELDPSLASVAVKETNKLGVNSILGNALEWLDDCWHGGYVGAPEDSRSWNRGLECGRRVVRGANWQGAYALTRDNATFFRPAGLARSESRPTLGFRLAGERK